MRALFPLMFICAGFVFCRVAWVAYRSAIVDLKDPNRCECTCTDPDIAATDFKVVTTYRGERTSPTCSCKDFLEPKLKQYVYSFDFKESCDICSCGVLVESSCNYDYTMISLLDMLSAAVIGATFMLIMFRWAQVVRYQTTIYRPTVQERNERKVRKAIRVLEAFFSMNEDKGSKTVKTKLCPPKADSEGKNKAFPNAFIDAKNYNTFNPTSVKSQSIV